MTVFHFATMGMRSAVAAVAAHGITDVDSPALLPAYALAFTPLPSHLVTAAFVLASVGHFAEDLGSTGSLLLHGCVGAVTAALGPQAGLTAVGGYLFFLHVPAHYQRCWMRGRRRALLFAAAGTIVTVSFASALPARLALGDVMQRAAIGHILVEATVRQRETSKPGFSF